MSLRARIAEAFRLDEVGYITDDSITEIEQLIARDHGVSVLDGEYDAVIVALDESSKEGSRIAGYIFNDKSIWKRASGDFTKTAPINKLAIPVDGLKLAYTKSTRYLVV